MTDLYELIYARELITLRLQEYAKPHPESTLYPKMCQDKVLDGLRIEMQRLNQELADRLIGPL